MPPTTRTLDEVRAECQLLRAKLRIVSAKCVRMQRDSVQAWDEAVRMMADAIAMSESAKKSRT